MERFCMSYKRKRLFALLFVGFGVAVVGFATTRAHMSNSRPAVLPPVSDLPVTSARALTAAALIQSAGEAELINLNHSGFEPAQITRPAGRFLLGVNNRTGLSDLTFQLSDENGRALGERRMVRDRVWRKVIDPPAGHYIVSVVGHSEWVCNITISPH